LAGDRVELTFSRVDNPGNRIALTAYLDDDMSYYTLLAAKKLGLKPGDRFSVTAPNGQSVPVLGRTVREVIERFGTRFNIAPADIAGR